MSLNVKDADNATTTLKTNGSGTHVQNVQIDSISAGDNNIGNVDIVTLPTFPAGDNNIGNVDIVTLPSLPSGTNNIGDVDISTLPGTVETDITAIKTAVEILDNAIIGSEMQVDIVTLPSLPSGTNNIGDVDISTLPGTVETDITAIKTSVQLIDNTVSGTELQVDVKSTTQPGACGNGKKTISTATTAEVIAGSNTVNHSVTIKALHANTNMVYVGNASVSAANGFVLDAGESVTLHVSNTNLIYIDVDTSSEGVTFFYS